MDFSSLLKPILDNQVAAGLSFTAAAGGLVYQLRRIPSLLRSGFLRGFTVELTVLSSDPAFDWLDRWLAAQPYAKTARMMRLAAAKPLSFDDTAPVTEWALALGPGTHMLFWRGRPVFVERRFLSKDAIEGHARIAKPIEQLHLRTIGPSQRRMRRLIEDARQMATKESLVAVRVWNDYSWSPVTGRSERPLDTIILQAGQCERILADLRWFMEAQDWYRQRGIPYRRGYCFAGPPGTGKTSIVLALAAQLGRPICVLNLNAVQDDNDLMDAFRQAPLNAIILLEDVDCAYPAQSRDAEDGDKPVGRISKAGLLNALDGITTPDGRIFVMTTNYPERLDAALIRPGRADVHERFEYFDAAEQIRMAERFFDGFDPLPFPVSPAEMQAACMKFHSDPKAAREYLLAKSTPVLAKVA